MGQEESEETKSMTQDDKASDVQAAEVYANPSCESAAVNNFNVRMRRDAFLAGCRHARSAPPPNDKERIKLRDELARDEMWKTYGCVSPHHQDFIAFYRSGFDAAVSILSRNSSFPTVSTEKE